MAQTKKKTAAQILGLQFPKKKSIEQIAGENEAMGADNASTSPDFIAEMEQQQAEADSAFAAPIEKDRIIQKSKNEIPGHIDKPAPHIIKEMEKQKARDMQYEKEFKQKVKDGEILGFNEFKKRNQKSMGQHIHQNITRMAYEIQRSEMEHKMSFADYAAKMPGQLEFRKNNENYS